MGALLLLDAYIPAATSRAKFAHDLAATGASPNPVQYRDSEVLTTKDKRVDITKSVRDLGHRNTFSLEEGMRLTAERMRGLYNLQTATVAAD